MAVHEVYPYLCVKSASAAIAFYQEAFGATEKFRLVEPSGRVGHAEIALGDHIVMLADEFPEMDFRAPDGKSPRTFLIHIHVDDADAVIANALKAGGTLVRAASDAFYGERSGVVRDPFGYDWMIGHAIEDVDPKEMQRRYDALMAKA